MEWVWHCYFKVKQPLVEITIQLQAWITLAMAIWWGCLPWPCKPTNLCGVLWHWRLLVGFGQSHQYWSSSRITLEMDSVSLSCNILWGKLSLRDLGWDCQPEVEAVHISQPWGDTKSFPQGHLFNGSSCSGFRKCIHLMTVKNKCNFKSYMLIFSA